MNFTILDSGVRITFFRVRWEAKGHTTLRTSVRVRKAISPLHAAVAWLLACKRVKAKIDA
jgi:hypothetical protein